MKYYTILKAAFAFACVTLATSASAQQVVLEKAVVAAGGARLSNSQTMMEATLGQAVTGRASNGTTVMQYGFWTSTAPLNSVPSKSPLQATSFEVWPNPATVTTGISLQLAKETPATISLFDESGKLVETLYKGNLSANRFTLPVAVDKLSSGAYFIAVQLPGEILQKRISVVK